MEKNLLTRLEEKKSIEIEDIEEAFKVCDEWIEKGILLEFQREGRFNAFIPRNKENLLQLNIQNGKVYDASLQCDTQVHPLSKYRPSQIFKVDAEYA